MSNEAFHFTPILNTERLTLTLFDPNDKTDCDLLAKGLMGISQGTLKSAVPEKDVDDAVQYYRKYGRIEPCFLGGRTSDRAAMWIIHLGENSPVGELVGIASMIQRSYIPDQGWVILPEYQGKGYAIEAAREVLRYFREEVGLDDIMAPTHPGNPKSRNVALRVGYIPREVGITFQDGTVLDLQTVPGASLPPAGMVLERFGRRV